VSIDRETGDFKVYALKKVTANPQNELLEISIENAKKINPDFEENDIVEIEVTPRKFGRIAAQTANRWLCSVSGKRKEELFITSSRIKREKLLPELFKG